MVGGNVRIGKTTNGRLTIENSSGTVKVQLDSNGVSYINGGNFGVGTGSSVDYKLHVKSADGSYGIVNENASGVKVGLYTGGSSASIGTATNHKLELLVNGDPKVSVGTDGKVGIGTESSTPAGLLEVKSATTNSDIVINAFTGKDARLYFQENSSSIFKIYTDGSETNNPLKIYDYASATDALTINNGKVGINSTNPNARLVVAGNSDAGDSTCAIHIIDNDSTSGSSVPNISFRSGASTQIYGIRANDTLGLTFRNSSDATKICFDDDGNIGVGINENISAKLQVEGGRIKVRQSDSYSGFL